MENETKNKTKVLPMTKSEVIPSYSNGTNCNRDAKSEHRSKNVANRHPENQDIICKRRYAPRN